MQEVVLMERDAVWQAFAETGDPIYYLLYKRMRSRKTDANENEKKDRTGQLPRPED